MEKDTASGRTPLTQDDYRKRVTTCASCSTPGRFATPRFGLGRRDAPVMVIAGQPARQLPRGNLAGGHMLHYVGEKYDAMRTNADKIVSQLLADLDIDVKDVYDTCAVKCPYMNGVLAPVFDVQECAGKHLRYELLDIRPRVIFCVGMTAVAGLFSAFPYPKIPECKNYFLGTCIRMRVIGNVIELPAFTPTECLYIDFDLMTYIVKREYRRINEYHEAR